MATMFVKIIQKGNTTIYPCEKFSLTSHTPVTQEDSPEESHLVYITLDDKPVSIAIDKNRGDEIYIMNDNGQTIDYYRWKRSPNESADDKKIANKFRKDYEKNKNKKDSL